MRKQIEKYFGFAPNQPRQVSNGPPKVSILMIPWDGQVGNLESLCIEAATQRRDRTGQSVHANRKAHPFGTFLGDKPGKPCLRHGSDTLQIDKLQECFVGLQQSLRIRN